MRAAFRFRFSEARRTAAAATVVLRRAFKGFIYRLSVCSFGLGEMDWLIGEGVEGRLVARQMSRMAGGGPEYALPNGGGLWFLVEADWKSALRGCRGLDS